MRKSLPLNSLEVADMHSMFRMTLIFAKSRSPFSLLQQNIQENMAHDEEYDIACSRQSMYKNTSLCSSTIVKVCILKAVVPQKQISGSSLNEEFHPQRLP